MLWSWGDRRSWLHKPWCNFSHSLDSLQLQQEQWPLRQLLLHLSLFIVLLCLVAWIRRQSNACRKLNPVISCRTAASIILWHCCILCLSGLMWVGRQTAGEGELWKSVFQGHLLVKLGTGERSEQPVSGVPQRDYSGSLCALQMSEDAARPISMATSSRLYNKPHTHLIFPSVCLCGV